nr:hypothetical protein [Tanacetum cinerariifolium]
MADVNAPSGQAPAMAPPVRTDDQILPHIKWVPIGKSNCYLDVEISLGNPIYKIVVDLLKNTNFFRAFICWDTVQYDKKAGSYRCQLDEQWFVLTKDTLREALQITPASNNQAFVAPPSSDVLINFVNELRSDPDSPAPKPTKPSRKPKSTAPKAPPKPSVSTPVTSAQPAPTSAPAKPQEKKRKPTTETSDEPTKAKNKNGFIGKKCSLKNVAESVAEDEPAKGPGNGYDKNGTNPSKNGQNRAQNEKREKVNSQKSIKSQTRQSQSRRNHNVQKNKEGPKLLFSKVI